MRNGIFILLLIVMASCKSKAVIAEAEKMVNATTKSGVNSETIIKSHYNTKCDFSTIYIKSIAKYKDEKTAQSVSAEIKIQKNQKILISVRVLGITMAKALVTPKEVKYYEKLNGTYFEGDYQLLSQWLGTDLDFLKIQNMLLGQPIDDMTENKYAAVVWEDLYKLNVVERDTEKSFFFGMENLLLKKQQVTQPVKGRKFEVDYPNFQDYATAKLPSGFLINASQQKGQTEIAVDYQSVTFNEDLSFPYSVPEGYERIFIN